MALPDEPRCIIIAKSQDYIYIFFLTPSTYLLNIRMSENNTFEQFLAQATQAAQGTSPLANDPAASTLNTNIPRSLAEATQLTEESGQSSRTNQERGKSHETDASIMKEMMQQ